jgi:hypothetical protein
MMPRLIIITYQQDYISPNTIEASGNQTKIKTKNFHDTNSDSNYFLSTLNRQTTHTFAIPWTGINQCYAQTANSTIEQAYDGAPLPAPRISGDMKRPSGKNKLRKNSKNR